MQNTKNGCTTQWMYAASPATTVYDGATITASMIQKQCTFWLIGQLFEAYLRGYQSIQVIFNLWYS